jgi:hypothetical protein
MKQANEIVKHLFCASNDKLAKSRFFLKAIGLMPKTIADELLFCYVKGETLFFVTKNRSMVFELNYKLKSIKEPLQLLAELENIDDFKNFQDIKAFATKYEPIQTDFVAPMTTYQENERSSGAFKIDTKEEKLSKIFNEIRELILRNTTA